MTHRQATPHRVAPSIAALLCLAPSAAIAQEHAPMQLILHSEDALDADARQALEAVIAASPLIEQKRAAAGPAAETNEARAVWLRGASAEAALLVTQQLDTVTLTTIGPDGEILGESSADAHSLATSAEAATRVMQRATGLAGPAVLRWRAQRGEPSEAAPVTLAETTPPPRDDAETVNTLTPSTQHHDPIFSLGLLGAPIMYISEPSTDLFLLRKLVGLGLRLTPPERDGHILGDSLFMDATLMINVDLAEAFVFDSSILLGGTLIDGDELDLQLRSGMRTKLHLPQDGRAEYVLIQLDLVGVMLRWTPTQAAELFAGLTAGFMPAPLPGGFGASATSQLGARYTSSPSGIYVGLRGEASQLILWVTNTRMNVMWATSTFEIGKQF